MRDKLENFVEQHVHEFDIKVPRKENWSLIEKKMDELHNNTDALAQFCLLYTSPSPRDKRQSRMPSSA